MGMSLRTALEIYTNPFDLSFVVSKDVIAISRGPGHDFKPLLTGKLNLKTLKEAAEQFGKILKQIVEASEKELQNTDSLLTRILNPKGNPPKEGTVLTHNMIEEIISIATSDVKGGF